MRSAVNRQKQQGAIDARADFQADEHEEATAEFGQDAEGQESRIDAKRAKMRRCEWSFATPRAPPMVRRAPPVHALARTVSVAFSFKPSPLRSARSDWTSRSASPGPLADP